VTPREVGEGMDGWVKGIAGLIGSLAVPVGDSLGWDGSHGPALGYASPRPPGRDLWSTEHCTANTSTYTARSRASASTLIGVFGEAHHHATLYYFFKVKAGALLCHIR
jgi:hypothetical protein